MRSVTYRNQDRMHLVKCYKEQCVMILQSSLGRRGYALGVET